MCVETREIGRSLRRPNATRARSPRPPLTAQLLEPTATELKALREAGLVPFALEPGREPGATVVSPLALSGHREGVGPTLTKPEIVTAIASASSRHLVSRGAL